MSNENAHGPSGDERYGRSMSQGSISSNLASWLSGRASPSASFNRRDSEASDHGFHDDIGDDEDYGLRR